MSDKLVLELSVIKIIKIKDMNSFIIKRCIPSSESPIETASGYFFLSKRIDDYIILI